LSTADVDNDSTVDVTYRWDALGRRVFRDDGTTASVYVQSGQQTIADYTSGAASSSPTYKYVYGSYIDEPVLRKGTGGDRYYHRTNQYSINALTDALGSIVERYTYDAYGGLSIFDGSGTARTSSAESNRYSYTGREWDGDLNLYHYRARMYDPVAGRFLARDPIGFDGSMWHLYEYAKSQPPVLTDPTGLSPPIIAPPPTITPPPTINPGALPPGIGGTGPIEIPDRLRKCPKPKIPKTKIIKRCVRIGGRAFLVVSVFVEGVLIGKSIGDECFPRIPVDSDRLPPNKPQKQDCCVYECLRINTETGEDEIYELQVTVRRGLPCPNLSRLFCGAKARYSGPCAQFN
ncbi:MAG: RHS repeat-associated core domain-containing protein, partial [Planctomycetota bacterium]